MQIKATGKLRNEPPRISFGKEQSTLYIDIWFYFYNYQFLKLDDTHQP